ncbi:MAG: sigma-70 family RNA polymerase sigma factor [Acidimicrobiales bacterium]
MAVTAPDQGDDGALVRAVQAGDVDAFAVLFRRHYPDVRRACARRVNDPGEADELAQAAFVRAFERIDQCAGDRRFGPWVHVIARSLCMDAFRARARVEPREEPLAGGREHRPNEPEQSVLARERAAQVHEALASLPDRQRRAVIARDWEGLRPGEIAERLGLSVGAVDSLLLRARRRLALSYRSVAGEGGRVAGVLPVRSAAATIGAALVFAPHAVMAGTAAAASAVQHTAGKAAGGVVAAVVSVAVSLGAASPAPEAPAAEPPAPVVTVVTVRTDEPVPLAPPPVTRATAPAPRAVTAPPASATAVPVAEPQVDVPATEVEAEEADPAPSTPEARTAYEPSSPPAPVATKPDVVPPPPVAPEPDAPSTEEPQDKGTTPTPARPAPVVAVDVAPVTVVADLPLPAVPLGES